MSGFALLPIALVVTSAFSPATQTVIEDSPTPVLPIILAQSESSVGGDGGGAFSYRYKDVVVINASDYPQNITVYRPNNATKEATYSIAPWQHKSLSIMYRDLDELSRHTITSSGKALSLWAIKDTTRQEGGYNAAYVVDGSGIATWGGSYNPVEAIAALKARRAGTVNKQQESAEGAIRKPEEDALRKSEEDARRRAAQEAENLRLRQLEQQRAKEQAEQLRAAKREARRKEKEQQDREKAVIIDSTTKAVDALVDILFK